MVMMVERKMILIGVTRFGQTQEVSKYEETMTIIMIMMMITRLG